MMNEKQIKEKINSLKKQIQIYEEILETKNEGMGRPIGSIKYTDEQIKFLKANKYIQMNYLIKLFNETFGANIEENSRALYNFMCRENIISYKQKGEIDRYIKQGTQKRDLKFNRN